jgi:spermidine/putrescine transport system permease protein
VTALGHRSAVPAATGVGTTRVPLRAFYWVLIGLLYLPIGVLFAFSFNDSTTLAFPMGGLTLDWYRAVFADAALIDAAVNSVIVGVVAATVATGLGFGVSVVVIRFRFRGRLALAGGAVLPLIVPFIVLGVALFLLFIFTGVPRSLLTIAIGHAVIALPFAVLIMVARIIGVDPALEDAAMDLGASYRATLRHVVVPLMAPSMVSAWLTCFIVSFDEVAIALFLAGGDPTFPVFLYGQLRFAQRLPVLIAMAVMLMIASLALSLVAYRVGRRGT